jgi:hypothetical protein
MTSFFDSADSEQSQEMKKVDCCNTRPRLSNKLMLISDYVKHSAPQSVILSNSCKGFSGKFFSF